MIRSTSSSTNSLACSYRSWTSRFFDHIFDHPNPSQLDSNGRPRKISFCEYVKELWTIPAIAIAGNTKSPADHISDCYPTANRYSEELVVLQHRINTPAKGKVR
jgi:chitinase